MLDRPLNTAQRRLSPTFRSGVHDLRVDVSDRLHGAQPIEIAVTVFLPKESALSVPPVVIFGVPGGGYSRGYYDMHFPGYGGYSQAHYPTARGLIFVASGPEGKGDRST